MIRIRAIVLDFDGVLADSVEAKTRAFEDLAALYPANREAMLAYHLANYGLPRRVKLEHYAFELMGRPGNEALLRAMAEQLSACAVRRVVAASDVPGAREFLAEFGRCVPLYLTSLTPQEELAHILEARGIAPYFVSIFGDPPVAKVEALRAVLERERLAPPEVLFVGDSPSDYHAAAAVGVPFVGRDSGVPLDGLPVERHRDLFEIARVVRARLAG